MSTGIEATGIELAGSVDQPCSDKRCQSGIPRVDLLDAFGEVVATGQVTDKAIGVFSGSGFMAAKLLTPLLLVEVHRLGRE
jgi:hypothetical protein